MSKLIKVEIRNVETGIWQWLGMLSEDDLTTLTILADALSDRSTDESS